MKLSFTNNNPKSNSILFAIKSNSSENSIKKSINKNEIESNSHKLFLMSEFCKFPLFELMPKQFSISTKNFTCYFNIIMIKKTSPVISELLKKNPEEKSFSLNVIDEENVLSKFEQLYQGKTVSFNEDEIPASQEITKILKIKNCPNALKPKSLKYNNDLCTNGKYLCSTILSNSDKLTVELYRNWFYEYLKKEKLRTFTISTKKKEYKCNIFGVYASNIIQQILEKDPTTTSFNYDFDDESDEFQLICDLFNFNHVNITNNNMYILKKIAEDLQINYIIKQINDFITNYEKITEKVEQQRTIINSINDLFDLLYNIKNYGIQKVKDSIMQSKWIQELDSIKELAAFIIQVIRSSFSLQHEMADLLIQLNKEANESNKLNELIPFINNILLNLKKRKDLNTKPELFFLNDIERIKNKYVFQFKYILYRRGIISKEIIYDKLKNYKFQNKYTNIYFLQELIDLYPKDINAYINTNKKYVSLIENYIPDKIDLYKKMLYNIEPDDELTKSLRNDDVDKLQSIIETDEIDIPDGCIPYNIFDDFLEKITLINYAAFCGSLNCFKYLLENNGKIDKSSFYFAVYGNNNEIIKIVESIEKDKQKNKKIKEKPTFGIKLQKNKDDESSVCSKHLNGTSIYQINYSNDNAIISSAIIMHRNKLFDWLFEKKFVNKGKIGNELKEIAMVSAVNGNVHSLIEIINKGCDVDMHIILCAAKNGFYKLSKLLLSMLNQKKKLFSLFDTFSSVFFGNLSIFELFFNEMDGATYNNSIVYAIKMNYRNIIDYFFDNIDKRSITKSLALSSLIESIKNNDLFDFLMEKFKKIKSSAFNYDSFTKLIYKACHFSNLHATEIITDLILNSYPNYDFTDCFFEALASNSSEICRYFYDKKVNINYEQLSLNGSKIGLFDPDLFLLIYHQVSQITKYKLMTNVCSVISKKNKKLIEFFLKEKVPKQTELITAVNTHELEIVDLVLKYNKEPSFINQEGGAALTCASKNKDLDIVKRLLSLPGIDPTLFDSRSETALSEAIKNKSIQIVDEIVNFFNGENIQKYASFFYKSFQLISKMKKINLDPIIRIFETTTIDPNYNEASTFLYVACMDNEIEIVERFLKLKNIDVNKCAFENCMTPLMISIQKKNIKIAKLLIQYPKTDLNTRNIYDESAFTIAVSNNLKAIVDIIINDDRFDPIESNFNFAFFNASSEITKQLSSLRFVDANYSFEIIENDILIERTALVHSVYINDIDKIDFIINHPSFDKDKSNIKKAIFVAAEQNNIDIFRKLIKLINNNINILNQKGNSLLSTAARHLSGNIIDEILNDPKFDAEKSQICKAFVQSYDSVQKGLYVSTPWIKHKIYHLAYDENRNQPKWEMKPDLNLYPIWQMEVRIMNEQSIPSASKVVEIMNKLYDYDKEKSHLIDFKKLLPNGRSFFTSIYSNYDEIDEVCNFLLDHGVDPNKKDNKGIFPLLTAIGLKSVKFVSILLNNAVINYSQLGNRTTYLHVAAAFSDSDVLKLLLEKNVIDINSKDINGDTPLIIACKAKKIKIVELLFEQDNLDYLHCNNDGIDALNIREKLSPSKNDDAKKSKKSYECQIKQILSERYLMMNPDLNANNVFSFDNQEDDYDYESFENKLGVFI